MLEQHLHLRGKKNLLISMFFFFIFIYINKKNLPQKIMPYLRFMDGDRPSQLQGDLFSSRHRAPHQPHRPLFPLHLVLR